MGEAGSERVCQFRKRLAERIGSQRYQTWFGASSELELDNTVLTVYVPTSFVGNWIVSNYLVAMTEVLGELVGGEPQVLVRVRRLDPAGANRAASERSHSEASPTDHAATDPAAAGRSSSERAAEDRDDSAGSATAGGRRSDGARSNGQLSGLGGTTNGEPAAPRGSLSNGVSRNGREHSSAAPLRGELSAFVVGKSNELAYTAAAAVARGPGAMFRHLVIHGGCGLGKTHLTQAICNEVHRTLPHLRWEYRSGEEFTNEFISAVKNNRVEHFRAQYRKIDLLAIDDIHFFADKRATQEEFLHTFNAIDASGKAVVMTTDRHPRDIRELSEPLLNRLLAAMVVEIEPPDPATRRAILERRAATLKAPLPDEVLDFLARHITSNVRVLEGALYRLVAFAGLTREAITLELARRAFQEFEAPGRPLGVPEILRVVSAHIGVAPEAVRSSSRDRNVTLARALTFFLARRHTKLSFPEIGRALNYKNHSTVVMAVQRMQQVFDRNGAVAWKTPAGFQDVPLRPLLEDLEQRLSSGQAHSV